MCHGPDMEKVVSQINPRDKIAALLSAVCAIHCVALPFATFLPFAFLDHHHGFFWGLSFALSIYSVVLARQHKNKKTLIFAVLAWAWFFCVYLLSLHEAYLAVSSTFLILSHLLNKSEKNEQKCCVHKENHVK